MHMVVVLVFFYLFFNSYYMCFILGKLSRVVEIENGKFQPLAKSSKYKMY